MEKKFIKYTSMLKDFRSYDTNIDYEEIFNTLEENVINDLDILTDYYYLDFKKNDDVVLSSLLHLCCVKEVDKLPINIKLYYIKEYKIPFTTSSNTFKKIGFTVYLKHSDILNRLDSDGVLQNIYFLIKDNINDDELKNYVYNLLFYAHIFTNSFAYSPMLNYLYHCDDIAYLEELKEVHTRLFGEDKECSVCTEKTIGKTECGHNLCQKCYCCIKNKKCPICRKLLYNQNDEFYEEITTQFFIN